MLTSIVCQVAVVGYVGILGTMGLRWLKWHGYHHRWLYRTRQEVLWASLYFWSAVFWAFLCVSVTLDMLRGWP